MSSLVDTVCEATPTIRSYPMRDRLEVSCFRDNQMVETQDTELREKTLSEEEKRWVPSFCAKIQGKLGDSCSPWSFFRRDEDVEMCCTALDKARDLTSGKVFRMEQRPGSRTKNVCPYPAECSGCVQTFGQKIRWNPAFLYRLVNAIRITEPRIGVYLPCPLILCLLMIRLRRYIFKSSS